MKVKIYDLSKTLSKYTSEWIALDPVTMKVVAVGKKPKTAIDEAKKKGIVHPVLTRAPKDYGTYIL
ncbi:MAG: hypothetical protein A2857_01590 [Candidatus Levybacteria bacterium RIFCSPHIGHO2_01_FULL_36_15]|nr:MAG: hypothetical protein A2857_01590 [Candidatus Levybacteria bacterium RIFCSPHIGHO2_01_FULL_36_15]OGH37562.1 MAG: hypothetical protein A2905_01330 [Candidatus Levybacteria bacterium RIFCSPLOWO2_01_FULL_36_10]